MQRKSPAKPETDIEATIEIRRNCTTWLTKQTARS